MKSIYKFIIITAFPLALLGLSGCEDFLETNPSSAISDADAFRTTDGAQTALNGIYWHLRRYNGGGAGRMDDHGVPAVIMTNDAAAGQDIVVWGGWYVYDYNLWGHTRGDIFKPQSLWNFYYRTINNANLILVNIDAADGPTAHKDAIKGQAKALRAYAYFNLIRFFQHTYVIAQNMPGVPIYTEPATADASGNPRAPVSEVYAFILDDLTSAIPLLQNYARGARKSTINVNVANGILAEVYLTMNRWEDAANAARNARTGYSLMSPDEFHAGFNDMTNREWMWAAPMTTDQNMSDYSPFAMWANWTRNGFTFQCFFLNDLFAQSFHPEDIRYAGQIQPDPWGVGLYISYKFRDTQDLTGDIVTMRASNMWLMEAEALARLGREADAKNVLWELQDARNAPRTDTSGEQLIEDILMERRKELYGEGHAWFDMIRNQKPMYRAGQHRDGLTPIEGRTIWPARSWRFVYQIPFNEMNSNESLQQGLWPGGDQNPFDGVYNP